MPRAFADIIKNSIFFIFTSVIMKLLYLSGQKEKGHQLNNESGKDFAKTKEYVWRQNKYYVGGATC